MAVQKLGNAAVGSIVKIKVNESKRDFIVVQHGRPSSRYDESCDGTWVLLKDIYATTYFSGYRSEYEGSNVDKYITGAEFFGKIDPAIQAVIKEAVIPFHSGDSRGADDDCYGKNGLSRKAFLLSTSEVTTESSMAGGASRIGTQLSYFKAGASKIAYYNGNALGWWTRTPNYFARNTNNYICADGALGGDDTTGDGIVGSYFGVRPAFILPDSLIVLDDGTVTVNAAPTISSSGGSNLGVKNAPFSLSYTLTDADKDPLSVTEKQDGVTTKAYTGLSSGADLTFTGTSTEADFRCIRNGSHTLQVIVSDGKESADYTASFTKAVYAASVTLSQPISADSISVAVLAVIGSIPEDATFKVEVTNNANDPSPAWQDATTGVQNGTNIVFTNQTATNGFAFNFRVSVSRGASGTGGYIESITGAFQ